MAPVGERSEWARNVLAAGHCRVQWHDRVYELDEPRMVLPGAVEDLPRLARRIEEFLGFRYVVLRRFADGPGSLEGAPHELGSKPEPILTA